MQGVWALFKYPNPIKIIPQDTPKIDEEILKMSISSM